MPKRHDNEKKEKTCIPKEGMPHVHKTCQKKKWKKKKEEKIYIYIAHVQEKIYKERDRSSNGVHLLSTKNIPHTCTS